MTDTALDPLDQFATRVFEGYVVRKHLNDPSDDVAMRLTILYYADAREALLKAISE